MTRRFLPRILPLLAALTLLLLRAPGSPAAPPRPLRVGFLPNLTHAPVLVAQERRDFERAMAPATIEWKAFPAGPRVIEALFAGELDLAYLGPGPAVNGHVRSGGRSFRLVSGLAQGGAAFVAREGSGLTDPAALANRKIATPQVGNTQDLALRHWIRTHGLKTREEGGTVEVIAIAAADQLALFQKGALDGAWAVEPWVTRLCLEGKGQVLMEESTIWPDGRYATTVLIAGVGLVERDPELVTRWLGAQESLLGWMGAEPDSARLLANAALLRLTGKGLPPAALAEAWGRLTFTSEPALASIETAAGWAAELGFLGRGRTADLSQFADLRFLGRVRGSAK